MTCFTSSRDGTIGRKALAAIFFAALLVRAANAVLLSADSSNFFLEDAQLYWPGSAYILETGRFDVPPEGALAAGAPGSERVPLYLLFLAGLRFLFGDSVLACILVQSAIDAVTCVMIALLGGMVGSRTGLVAGALAAISPTMVVLSATLLSDTLFLYFFTALLLLSAGYLARARPWKAGLAGLCCGLSIMTRTVAQFLPLVMVLAAPLIALAQRRGTRIAIASGVSFAIATALPITPWLFRNVVEHDSWTLTTQDGTHVAAWLLPLVRQAQDGTPHEVAAREIEERFQAQIQSRGIDFQSLSAFEKSRLLRDMGLEELSTIPLLVLSKAWVKGAVINLAAPAITIDPRVRRERTASVYNDSSPSLAGRLENYLATTRSALRPLLVGAMAASAVALLLEMAGFVLLIRRMPWAAFFTALVILYVLLVTGPIYSPKYRLPIEPVLIVLTALSLEAAWGYLARRVNREVAAANTPTSAD